MIIYCVMEIQDYEYGCRDIESVWATYEQAEAHIEELGNKEVTFWNGSTLDKYTVNSYRVEGLQEE